MVKLTVDTNKDDLADLEEALQILQDALKRRGKKSAQELVDEEKEDTALDAGFLKITVESEMPEETPVTEDLSEQEMLTDDEFSAMLAEEATREPKEKKAKKEEASQDSFIEIIEFDDD